MHNKLPTKYYFINKFDTNYIDKQDSHTVLIYRNYNLRAKKRLILKIRNYCKRKGNKFLLSNNIKLALSLKLDGIYIPSFNKTTKHLNYTFRKNFIIVGSAHNLKEMIIKKQQGVQAIFLSSIFKKNKNYLGVNKFKLMSFLTKKKIIALGGISSKNLRLLSLTNCYGIAGISFFE
jgi:thiamine-phosphate pyrophosphorylase